VVEEKSKPALLQKWQGCGTRPEKAISDGAQSLDLAQFQKMMKDLQPYIQLWKDSREKEVAAATSH